MAEVVTFKAMVLQKDKMAFKNLDRVCLNLLAYKWIHAGPPGTLMIEQITGCFADIPKDHVHETLATLDKKGLILLEAGGKRASLTQNGFNHIRSAVAKPVCADAALDSILT